MPEIIEQTLHLRRGLENERAVLEVDEGQPVDHVRIGRADDGLGTDAILPDGEHVVARAKRRRLPVAHGDHVHGRQRP
jgi:hypothetical protein